MAVVLDAGALVAIDRGDRPTGLLLEQYRRRSVRVLTSAAVVAQVWRGSSRQARLAKSLGTLAIQALDPVAGQRAGELLGAARTRDVVDAHVALLVNPGDTVMTSDPRDVLHLLETRGVPAAIVRV